MSLFRRKQKEEVIEGKEENNVTETENKDVTDDGGNTDNSKLGDDGVPQVLKDKLGEIRASDEPGWKDVEVKDGDDDTDEVKDDDSTDSEEEVKDDDLSAGDSSDDSSESEDVDEQLEYEEIDPRLVEAGRAFGFSDDKIRTIAEADESILADLAVQLEKKDKGHREDKEEVKEDESTIDEDSIEKLREKFGDEGVEVLLGLKKENDNLKKRFKEVDELKQSNVDKDANRVLMQHTDIANKVFDSNVETFKEFGTTKDFKKYPDGTFVRTSELEVRHKVWNVAHMFHKENGGSFQSAMEQAMQWYTGADKESTIARKIVKDINKQKKRFTVKPNRRKVKRVFKDENSKKSHIIQGAMKKAGIKV